MKVLNNINTKNMQSPSIKIYLHISFIKGKSRRAAINYTAYSSTMRFSKRCNTEVVSVCTSGSLYFCSTQAISITSFVLFIFTHTHAHTHKSRNHHDSKTSLRYNQNQHKLEENRKQTYRIVSSTIKFKMKSTSHKLRPPPNLTERNTAIPQLKFSNHLK